MSNGKVVTSWDGYKFYVENKDDEQVIGKSEIANLKALATLSSKEKVFVDAGANLGFYTVRLAKYYKHVYAFEPEPRNFTLLSKNVELNNITNVSLLNFALGDKNEKKYFYPKGSASTFLSGFVNEKPIEVSVVKGDDLLDKADVIKIDVEGYEYFVIKGLESTISKFNPYILIEHHDFRHYHTNFFPAIQEFLKPRGYFFLFITPVHRFWVHKSKQIQEYKFLLFHHWFNYCIRNLENGRPWYYGIPYEWWYGMNLIDFWYELPNHLESEPLWLSLVQGNGKV
jgi:FkbM family methyltransferase